MRRRLAVPCVFAVSLVAGGLVFGVVASPVKAAAAGSPISLVPARLLETRSGPSERTIDGAFQGGGELTPGAPLELPVTGRGGVPTDAAAVLLNVTVVDPTGPGFVTVYPCGTMMPLASNVNFTAGDVVPNAVLAKVGSNGMVCIYTSAPTHVVVDVNGYVPVGASPNSLVPGRLLETRSGQLTVDGAFQGVGALGPGNPLALTVAGRGGVAADAAAAFLNVTVVNPSTAGFVTVYPCSTTRPLASNLNFLAGDVVANAVFAEIGIHGDICIFASTSTDVVVDVNGYVPAGASPAALLPARLLETRNGQWTVDGAFQGGGEVAAGTSLELPVTGRGGVPGDAVAVFLNVTAVDPTGPGFVTVYPCGTAMPLASNLNYVTGDVVPNAVFAKVGNNGRVCIYSSSRSDIVVDVNGYVPAGPVPAQVVALSVDVRAGYITLVDHVAVTNATLASVVADAVPGVDLAITLSSDDTNGVVTVRATVAANTTPGARQTTVHLQGCSSVPCTGSGVSWSLPLTINVLGAGGGPADQLLIPTNDRWVATSDNEAVLPDEVTVVGVGPQVVVDLVEEIAQLGGEVVAVDSQLAILQVKVAPPAMAGLLGALAANPMVASATQTTGSASPFAAVPPDWSDDTVDATWPFLKHRAVAAWDITTGSRSTELGIVDSGVFDGHSDLLPNMRSYRSFDTPAYLGQQVRNHGTHVAGTACGAANNSGLVGVSWSCGLRVLDIGSTLSYMPAVVITSQVNKWLDSYPRIRTVNMSFGSGATNPPIVNGVQDWNQCLSMAPTPAETAAFRQLFARQSQVLFVVAAGNCRVDVSQVTPANLANDFANVVSVAATDINGQPSSFTNTGAEVRGPGTDIWSSTHSCVIGTGHCTSTFGVKSGTSMAAPFVAGTAGLMFTVRPDLWPTDIADCLVSNQIVHGAGVASIDVLNAVGCARNKPVNACTASSQPSRIDVENAMSAIVRYYTPAPPILVPNFDSLSSRWYYSISNSGNAGTTLSWRSSRVPGCAVEVTGEVNYRRDDGSLTITTPPFAGTTHALIALAGVTPLNGTPLQMSNGFIGTRILSSGGYTPVSITFHSMILRGGSPGAFVIDHEDVWNRAATPAEVRTLAFNAPPLP